MSAELKCRYCCTTFPIGNARRPEDVRCPFCKKPFCDAEMLTRFRAMQGSFGTFDCDKFELQRRSRVRFSYDVFDAKEQRIGVVRSPLRVGQGCFAVIASVTAFVGVPLLFAITVTQLGRKLGNADALGLDGPQPPLHTFAVIVLLLVLGLVGAAAVVWLTRPRTRITLYADNTRRKTLLVIREAHKRFGCCAMLVTISDPETGIIGCIRYNLFLKEGKLLNPDRQQLAAVKEREWRESDATTEAIQLGSMVAFLAFTGSLPTLSFAQRQQSRHFEVTIDNTATTRRGDPHCRIDFRPDLELGMYKIRIDGDEQARLDRRLIVGLTLMLACY